MSDSYIKIIYTISDAHGNICRKCDYVQTIDFTYALRAFLCNHSVLERDVIALERCGAVPRF